MLGAALINNTLETSVEAAVAGTGVGYSVSLQLITATVVNAEIATEKMVLYEKFMLIFFKVLDYTYFFD